MPRVKVTGYIELDDEEYDPGPNGPLTEEVYEAWHGVSGKSNPCLSDLDDLDVVLAED